MSKRVITVASRISGYKTNFAVLFGIALSFEGYKVLLIDLNSDGSLSKCFRWNGEGKTINDILSKGSSDIGAYKSVTEDISYIPADKEKLYTLNKKLGSSKDNPLKNFIDELNGFDRIIFDCSPIGSNMLTEKAVELSDNIIVSPSNVPQHLNMIHSIDEELEKLRYIIESKGKEESKNESI